MQADSIAVECCTPIIHRTNHPYTTSCWNTSAFLRRVFKRTHFNNSWRTKKKKVAYSLKLFYLWCDAGICLHRRSQAAWGTEKKKTSWGKAIKLRLQAVSWCRRTFRLLLVWRARVGGGISQEGGEAWSKCVRVCVVFSVYEIDREGNKNPKKSRVYERGYEVGEETEWVSRNELHQSWPFCRTSLQTPTHTHTRSYCCLYSINLRDRFMEGGLGKSGKFSLPEFWKTVKIIFSLFKNKQTNKNKNGRTLS